MQIGLGYKEALKESIFLFTHYLLNYAEDIG